jgi:sulfotransferase
VSRYHFISGLPRSGSTLLVSVLNQNPRFFAEITNPLCDFVREVVTTCTSLDPSFNSICPPERLKSSIEGLFAGYYASKKDKEVFFNTNRAWTAFPEYLFELNSNFKIVACVRSFADVLNSFEKLYKKRGLTEALPLYGHNKDNVRNVYARTEFLAGSATTRFCYTALREMYYGQYKDKHLMLVEYNDLVLNPKSTLRKIYDFVEEPYFEHDFNKVEFSFDEYDRALKLKGLHDVGASIKPRDEKIVLPPDLYNTYKDWNFWRPVL